MLATDINELIRYAEERFAGGDGIQTFNQVTRIDPQMGSAADMLLNDLKQLHLIVGITDPDIQGGITTAYPVDAPFIPYSIAIPNRRVKFLADGLLQRLFHEHKIPMVGLYQPLS